MTKTDNEKYVRQGADMCRVQSPVGGEVNHANKGCSYSKCWG